MTGDTLREVGTRREDILKECRFTPFRSGGPGGQRRNKVATAIRIQHVPSGIVVIGRRYRELARNRKDAEDRLVERVRALARKPKRRRATVPTREGRERRLRQKRKQARRKEERRKVRPEQEL
jgi:protein subunit release factor B